MRAKVSEVIADNLGDMVSRRVTSGSFLHPNGKQRLKGENVCNV